MAALSPFLKNIILFGVFTISIISFSLLFIGENNADSEILNDSVFNATYRSINSTLSTLQKDIDKQRNYTENDNAQPTISLFLILDSFRTVPWSLWNLVSTLVTTIWLFVFANIFGESFVIISGALFSIILITITLLIIKFIRQGESER